ncbi:TPA: hypothetical protein DCX16_01135 [bacterium]|nr:hypothetical protein [bacterium]
MNRFLLGIILFISLFLNIWGIWGGLPSKERTNLVFSESQIKGLSKIMKETRDEIYQRTEYFGSGPVGFKNEMYRITLDGIEHEISKFHIGSARSFLIRSCYPDEQAVLASLGNMNPSKLDFNPHMFSYGGLYIYLIGFSIKIAALLNLLTLTPDTTYYFLHPGEMGKFFVIGRLVGALIGVLAIYIIYLIGSFLYDKRTGLIAGLFLSLLPAVIIYAHYLKPYVFNLFFFLLSFYWTCKVLYSDKISNYILAGLFAGIAGGILLPFGTIFICIPIAHLIKRISTKISIRSLFEKSIILSILSAIIGFIIVNPYLLVSLKEAFSEYMFLSRCVPPNFSFDRILSYSKVSLPAGFGLPLFVVVIAGILYSFYKREKIDYLILSYIIPLFFFITATTYRFIHYGIYILPFLILLSARVLGIGLKGGRMIRHITLIIILFVSIYTFLYSLSYDRVFAGRDIKTEAGKWIVKNIEKGESIGFRREPTPYAHPPINILEYKVSWIDENGRIDPLPKYFVESENDSIPDGFRSILKFQYCEIKRFERHPEVFGVKLFFGKNYPWWWKTPNPDILLYKRLR